MLYPAELRALEGVRFIAQRIADLASLERRAASEFSRSVGRRAGGVIAEALHSRRNRLTGRGGEKFSDLPTLPDIPARAEARYNRGGDVRFGMKSLN
jgi:hypothetical protein